MDRFQSCTLACTDLVPLTFVSSNDTQFVRRLALWDGWSRSFRQVPPQVEELCATFNKLDHIASISVWDTDFPGISHPRHLIDHGFEVILEPRPNVLAF